MTIGLKFATIITALTPLIVSGILVAAVSISATVQGSSVVLAVVISHLLFSQLKCI